MTKAKIAEEIIKHCDEIDDAVEAYQWGGVQEHVERLRELAKWVNGNAEGQSTVVIPTIVGGREPPKGMEDRVIEKRYDLLLPATQGPNGPILERPQKAYVDARWAEEHKGEISPFLPVEEPGWIDQCKYRFPVAKRPVQRLANAWRSLRKLLS